jgi:hypothetical protein
MPDLIDESLNFGSIQFGHGKAFLSDAGVLGGEEVRVGKTWEIREGRTLLIERVLYEGVVDELKALPDQAMNFEPDKNAALAVSKLAPKPKRTANPGKPKRFAIGKKEDARKGFTIDYIAVPASNTSYDFLSSSTYYLSGTVTVTGQALFEGATVLKFDSAVGTKLVLNGTVVFNGSRYAPILFTGKDDNSIGENIAGSTPTWFAGLRLRRGPQFRSNVVQEHGFLPSSRPSHGRVLDEPLLFFDAIFSKLPAPKCWDHADAPAPIYNLHYFHELYGRRRVGSCCHWGVMKMPTRRQRSQGTQRGAKRGVKSAPMPIESMQNRQ